MYTVDVLVQGFPGKAVCHGGLGWSTISLIRGHGRVMLLDVGAFGVRRTLKEQLTKVGVAPDEVTDVVLTHAHYDHAVNFTLFPQATVWIGEAELQWAAAQLPGFNPLPELYVRELQASPRVRHVRPGERFLPGLQAIAAPGHTPGHLVFLLDGAQAPVLFTGDAAKNRAELQGMRVDASLDHAASGASLQAIWDIWRAAPGTILVPGHDLSMVLDHAGKPQYTAERQGQIAAWFGETLAEQSIIDLCCPSPPGLFRNLVS
ncbi:MBL fold metallo-hydrolase [Pandoraea pnomenusa]|uniref:MBL fold metallo-hydrolase n=1 Tax=Pandoraea pnomenusa TaxID=93220 RepID=UPI0007BC996C|nr:MBL fold metallo-hydrolase [Pandoraea pnomenusa]ANC42937.1 MBL fold hydrolase [Pandoraea pnomenusa]